MYNIEKLLGAQEILIAAISIVIFTLFVFLFFRRFYKKEQKGRVTKILSFGLAAVIGIFAFLIDLREAAVTELSNHIEVLDETQLQLEEGRYLKSKVELLDLLDRNDSLKKEIETLGIQRVEYDSLVKILAKKTFEIEVTNRRFLIEQLDNQISIFSDDNFELLPEKSKKSFFSNLQRLVNRARNYQNQLSNQEKNVFNKAQQITKLGTKYSDNSSNLISSYEKEIDSLNWIISNLQESLTQEKFDSRQLMQTIESLKDKEQDEIVARQYYSKGEAYWMAYLEKRQKLFSSKKSRLLALQEARRYYEVAYTLGYEQAKSRLNEITRELKRQE